MQYLNSYVRTVCCGAVLGVATLLSACQPGGHNSSTWSHVASSKTVPSTDTSAASPGIAAYTPGAMQARRLTSCNLEAMGAVRFGAQPMSLNPGGKGAFAGWIDASGLTQPAYWLRFDDQSASHYFQVPVKLTLQRSDVAATHPGAPLVSGFDVSLPIGGLPDGKYHIYLATTVGDVVYVCDNGRYVTVAP